MPHLRPFRGVRYDPRAVGDVGAVLCPPYDVIDADLRARLMARHPRNAVRLELPDGYDVAGRLFAEWRADGGLLLDERPLIYVYEQQYDVAGVGHRRATGFFCRLRLEEYGAHVRRHERTHAAPKEDRYLLLSAVRANLSPVLMLYDDGAGGATARRLIDSVTLSEPDLRAADAYAGVHALWALDPIESPAAASLLDLAAARPLTIADGHHRYETALRFRADEPSADSALVLLYEASSGGLAVLPTHRLLRGQEAGRLLDHAAASGWEVQRLSERELLGDTEDRLASAGTAIGAVTRDGAAVLTADPAVARDLVGAPVSEALRSLPVAVLDGALERWLGRPVTDLVAEGRIMYSKEARDAVEQLAAGAADAVFLLPSTPIAAVLDAAAAGEVMPQKSTYFEPKAATGLVFNPLDE